MKLYMFKLLIALRKWNCKPLAESQGQGCRILGEHLKKSAAVKKKKDHGCSLVMAYRFYLFDANILDLTEKKEKQIPEW